jgi:hypothetical protein
MEENAMTLVALILFALAAFGAAWVAQHYGPLAA